MSKPLIALLTNNDDDPIIDRRGTNIVADGKLFLSYAAGVLVTIRRINRG